MREIKFRGMRLDNKEWVYGTYMPQYHSFKHGKRIDAIFYSDEHKTYRIPVIPETAGQYTGSLDKNDIEVYEGDILRIHQFLFDGNEHEHELTGTIVYNEKSMCFGVTNMQHEEIRNYMGFGEEEFKAEFLPVNSFYGLHEESFEIIGNIHERSVANE